MRDCVPPSGRFIKGARKEEGKIVKFDMGDAWRDAMAMLSANREVMLIVVGVFSFLPSLAAVLLVPEMQPPAATGSAEQAERMLMDYYSANAPIFIVLTLLQTLGFIALLALLRDDRKPTVGEALKIGAVGLLPYIGTQILVALAALAVLGVAVGIPIALGANAVGGILGVLALPVAAYVFTKLSLVTPVIAIEKVINPITVLNRSWRLTKGNSVRLFFFYLLLMIVFVVIALISSIVFGILNAMLGQGTASLIASGLYSGLLGAAAMLVFAAVLAAVHRQLSGQTAGGIGAAFE